MRGKTSSTLFTTTVTVRDKQRTYLGNLVIEDQVNDNDLSTDILYKSSLYNPAIFPPCCCHRICQPCLDTLGPLTTVTFPIGLP